MCVCPLLSKMDLLSPSAKRHIDAFLHPDTRELTSEAKTQAGFGGKFARMTAALGQVLEDYRDGIKLKDTIYCKSMCFGWNKFLV